MAVRAKAADQRSRLDRSVSRIRAAVSASVSSQRQKVDMLSYRIGALNPASVLAKGFTLTLKDGRRVSWAAQLQAGDVLTTVFADGNIKSTVFKD